MQRIVPRGWWLVIAGLATLFATSCKDPPSVMADQPEALPRYGIFEQTFDWKSAGYANPWEQVTVTVTFTSPTGEQKAVGGFYYAPNTWKVRFSPNAMGDWRWQAAITDGHKSDQSGGSFTVVASNSPGFVRSNPTNPFRWVFDDGTSYNPIGIGDCINEGNRDSSALNKWGLDGGFRPPESGRTVDIDTYMHAYSVAGVNLFRWSVDNCAFNLYQIIDPSGNVYLLKEGMAGDALVRTLRQYGFRTYMVIFGFNPPGAGNGYDAIKRYVKYVVDRYGAYVDFWELMNEATEGEEWYREIARYLRSIDPYKHPLSTSWARPDLAEIEINSPHWYQDESEFDSDVETWNRFQSWKQANKPVIVGEQGNNQPPNWTPRSGLRMRLRAWTAFFAEGVLIFWNSSYAKDNRGIPSNIYLGPEERGYLKVLQDFTRGFDAAAAIATVQVSDPAAVRGYALRSPSTYAVYLHAYTNHASPTTGISVEIEPKASGAATWIEPATGRQLRAQQVPAGRQTLIVPAFITDIALKIK